MPINRLLPSHRQHDRRYAIAGQSALAEQQATLRLVVARGLDDLDQHRIRSDTEFFTTASVMSLISARFCSFERPSMAWT
jgi:hypothetical protein